MVKIGFLDRFRNRKVERTRIQMVTEHGNGFYAWNGKVYQSDIVRACIHPKVKAIGKLIGKHLRRTIQADGEQRLQVNPEPYIRHLLEEPNPYMTGQKLQEKLANQLCLNNNAFAVILRDEFGYPAEIYPVPALSADALYDRQGQLYLRFLFQNGKTIRLPILTSFISDRTSTITTFLETASHRPWRRSWRSSTPRTRAL